jgi:hypothetical protein
MAAPTWSARRWLAGSAAGMLLSLVPVPADGQSQASTGQIAGRVSDSSGAVMPGVVVRISSAATGIHREVSTNDRGIYAVPLLPVGIYVLSAERRGFQSVTYEALVVTVGATLRRDLTMRPGGVLETVTVGNAAVPVDVTSPVASTTLGATFLEKTPTNGRRFQDLIELTPNAQVEIQRGQIALSGQRGISSNIAVDGTDYNQPFFGGIRGGSRSKLAATIPQDAIRQFQVVASGYSVEFGRSTGGLVNVVTKEGSNRWSGSAFYVNRHQALATSNVFGDRTAPTQQQWGASSGGPVRRDRLFYFAAYEQQEVSMPRAVRFDLIQGVSPAADTQEAFDYYKSLEGPFTTTNDALTFLGRVDWQWRGSTRVDVRYSGSTHAGLNAISPGDAVLPATSVALSSNGTERDRISTVVGQLTDARRSNLLFEVRAQYATEAHPWEANAIAARVQTAVGRFGTTSFLGQNDTRDRRWQTATGATMIAGTHTLKLGAELNSVRVDSHFGLNQTGGFVISGTNPTEILETLSVGGPVPNRFDSPAVTYVRQVGNLRQSLATTEFAVFVQDSWRLAPTFTLTSGLRWEGQWHPSPESNNSSLVDRIAGFTFPSGRQVDPTHIPDDLAQLAPRAGFAWNPRAGANTVVRGNAGLYYARSPGIIFAQPLAGFRLPAADLSLQLPFPVPPDSEYKTVHQQLALIGIDLNRTPLDALPIISPEQIDQVRTALGLPPFSGAQVFVIDPEFSNPQAFQWGFGIEREVRAGLIVGAEYADIETTNLERNTDLNLPVPFVRASDPAQRPFFALRSGGQRPIPSLSSVTVRESGARSHYRAVTLRVRLQKRWGEMYGSYVFGRSLSDDDNEADIGGMILENPYDLAAEYSFARLDRRHQVAGGWMIRMPWGLEAAGSLQVRSGLPVDATMGRDANESLGGMDRPYHAPGVPFERNLFRNRPTSSVNLHVVKQFRVLARSRLSVIMDVFNLFNVDGLQYAGAQVLNYCTTPSPASCGFGPPSNPNFLQLVDRTPGSATFGQYLPGNAPGEPRQIQLGVRFTF